TPAVIAQNINVELGGTPILHGVNFTANPGELVALVGPNGAGKSTLLAALCGDVPIAGGRIEIAGHDLGSVSYRDLARERAVQLQDSHLSFAFTVDEVV